MPSKLPPPFFFLPEGVAVPPASWERQGFGHQSFGRRVCVPTRSVKDAPGRAAAVELPWVFIEAGGAV